MMTSVSSAPTPPPASPQAWDVVLRDHLINACRAPAAHADEVVDLIRHARDQVRERLIEIASMGRSDWVRSMVLANATEMIRSDLDEVMEAVRSMETAAGRPMTSTAVHVTV